MREISVKVYNAEDLKKEGNRHVLNNILKRHSDINVDYDWWVFEKENLKDELTALGFTDVDSTFSGFYSQGDGAAIGGSISVTKACELLGIEDEYPWIEFDDISVTFGNYNNMYFNEIYWSVGSANSIEQEEDINRFVFETASEVKRYLEKKSQEYFRRLRDEYEYRTSKESIIALIEANDYEFFDDGRMV